MKCRSQNLPLILFFAANVSAETSADTFDKEGTCCRNPRTVPHQNGLWSQDWPNKQGDARAICDGTLSVADDGEICIDGRMTYRQIAEELGSATFAPAAETISLTGHLVAGTGNVVLGGQTRFIYDFVSSYTVGGTDYVAGPDMLDNLLGASKGTIDKICLISNFTQPEFFYKIKHKISFTKRVDMDAMDDSNLVLGNKFTFTIATHCEVDKPGPIVGIISKARMALFNLVASFPTPCIVLYFVPVLSLLGLLRQIIVGSSTVSTFDYPPLASPDQDIENIQIDAPWSSLMSVVEDGVFAEMSILMGTVIKRITATESSNGCWKEDTAAIDLQAPVGRADDILEFVNNFLFPELEKLGDVSLHFGKHIPEGSKLLAAAISKFESCGASVNLNPNPCYHPGCTRSINVTEFEYPPKYYKFD